MGQLLVTYGSSFGGRGQGSLHYMKRGVASKAGDGKCIIGCCTCTCYKTHPSPLSSCSLSLSLLFLFLPLPPPSPSLSSSSSSLSPLLFPSSLSLLLPLSPPPSLSSSLSLLLPLSALSYSSSLSFHTQAEFTDQASDIATPPAPSLRVTRPSITSSDSDSIVASVDEDFTRLAKARSNPDILRTTLKNDDITGIEWGQGEWKGSGDY